LESGELGDAVTALTLIKGHLSNSDLYVTDVPIDLGYEYRQHLKNNAYSS